MAIRRIITKNNDTKRPVKVTESMFRNKELVVGFYDPTLCGTAWRSRPCLLLLRCNKTSRLSCLSASLTDSISLICSKVMFYSFLISPSEIISELICSLLISISDTICFNSLTKAYRFYASTAKALIFYRLFPISLMSFIEVTALWLIYR